MAKKQVEPNWKDERAFRDKLNGIVRNQDGTVYSRRGVMVKKEMENTNEQTNCNAD